MLFTKAAMLFLLQSVRGIFFVFHAVVVALLTLGASQGNLNSHSFSFIIAVYVTVRRTSPLLPLVILTKWSFLAQPKKPPAKREVK